MKKSPPKTRTVRAWGLWDKEYNCLMGRVAPHGMNKYHAGRLLDSWYGVLERTLIRVTITYTPPKPKARKA